MSRDIGRLNGLGYCHIKGRIKDMIIRGGENIYPAEIEQLLLTHPKVQEVQVRPTATGGQQRYVIDELTSRMWWSPRWWE